MGFFDSVLVLIRTSATNRRPPQPRTAPGTDVVMGAIDFEEPLTANWQTIKRGVGALLFIEYLDNSGSRSRRRITVRRIDTNGEDLMLAAWCHERQAPRHFKLSNIQTVFDPHTGELIDSAEVYLSKVLEVPIGREPPPESHSVRRARRRCRPGLQTLLWLARADGHEDPNETQIVVEWMLMECAPPQIEPLQRGDAARLMAELHPDPENFVSALEFIDSWSRPRLRRLHDATARLIAADERIADAERLFMNQLSQVVGSR